MIIYDKTYHTILASFPNVPPEAGCILGMQNGIICEFAYDAGIPRYDAAIYTPNIEMLNQIIAAWNKKGIFFCGLAHSHPQKQKSLSLNDKNYIINIMKSIPISIKKLYFPLVFPGSEMISFVGIKGSKGVEINTDNIIIHNTKERL